MSCIANEWWSDHAYGKGRSEWKDETDHLSIGISGNESDHPDPKIVLYRLDVKQGVLLSCQNLVKFVDEMWVDNWWKVNRFSISVSKVIVLISIPWNTDGSVLFGGNMNRERESFATGLPIRSRRRLLMPKPLGRHDGKMGKWQTSIGPFVGNRLSGIGRIIPLNRSAMRTKNHGGQRERDGILSDCRSRFHAMRRPFV